MTQTVFREEKPVCYGVVDDPAKGRDGWNPNHVECTGGLDPTFRDPETGSHVRKRCDFFQSCGALAQARRQEAARPIDPKTLIRTTTPSFTPSMQQPVAQPLTKFGDAFAKTEQQRALEQQMQQMQQLHAAQMEQMRRMMPQQMPQQMMPQMATQMGYQQMMPVNYQMPAYLTAPEPTAPGGFWKMFGRTVFRSMGKSVGHSVAYMFDSVPFGTPPTGKSG